MQKPELWTKIRSCHPDDVDAAFPFSACLARDNGWSLTYAQKVIVEYQKFAYLSRVSPGIVTPSDEVDQAWHLHLTYTRHYWGPFKEALGGPLHHMPTKGGAEQNTRFMNAYRETLDLYAAEFGAPPADIWPPEEVRFGRAPHFARVNTQDFWMVRKPAIPRAFVQIGLRIRSVPSSVSKSLVAATALLLGTGLAFAHGSPAGDTLIDQFRNMVWHWLTQHTFAFLFVLLVIGFVLYAFFYKGSRRGGSNSGCSTSSCGSDSDSGGSSGCSGCGGGGD